MSRENVGIALGVIEAWNHGDRDGWLAPTDAETEWSSAVLRAVEGTDTAFVGRAELKRFWDEWHALWDLQLEATEVRDLGETVVLLTAMRTKGSTSGAEVVRSTGFVFDFNGLVVRRCGHISVQRKPSKPWGCGSRWCRRRTSR